ncbi:uncharacterized protein LOC119793432 [Cyprinodon tularosa]|uniref:uncharacterized protein LOC119793432 n=1 Tax=Cyprinodon tularosa TaxID=77115 RepID=UPI0018E21DE6|nr:uncharacterized protein LOC119793432 [Cyprinodon tularosa]
MHVFRSWAVLCVLAAAISSLHANENDFDDGFADDYGNEISLDQQEQSPTKPCRTDFSHWDKLFIALEDFHMRQNMLLDSMEQCCGGMVSLRSQMDKLLRGASQQTAPRQVSACRGQTDLETLRLQHSLAELHQGRAEMERRINATLQMILNSQHEDSARLNRLEEAVSENSRNRHQPTQRPGGLGWTSLTEQEEQEASSQLNLDMIKSSLVSIARDVQRLYLQLSTVIEQTGTLRKGRGDT